jgi:tetratricopeptide (TPR) repeat protein
LVPVIGFVQVGRQSMADRYAYIPFIGLFIMISWSLPIIKRARILTVLTITCILITFSVASYQYIGMWSSTVKLFEDIVKRNPQNHFAYNMLGLVEADRGEHNKALYYFYLALKIKPDYSPAYLNAGNVFLDEGKDDQAIYCYKKAVLIDDLSPENHNNLGAALMMKKDIDGGISSFKNAIRLRPDYIMALNNLGVAQMQKENIEEALQCFKQVLKLQPDNATAIENIKILLNKKMKVIKTADKGIIAGNERLQR